MSLVPLVARAQDAAEAPGCQGFHSLASPLPERCLGVIDTDRPHQTDTPHVVPAGHAQVESAVAEVELGGTLGAVPSERSPRVVLLDNFYKVGLVTDVDVEVFFTHAAYDAGARQLQAPGPLDLRAKLQFVHASGWVPDVTFVPWVFLPVAPSEVLRGGPYLFWAWKLPSHFELEMNAGALFGARPKPAAAPVLASALTYEIVDGLGIFVDVYTTGPDAALGTGMLWAFTRDMQIDLGTYVGVHGDEPVATPFLGFSIRQ